MINNISEKLFNKVKTFHDIEIDKSILDWLDNEIDEIYDNAFTQGNYEGSMGEDL